MSLHLDCDHGGDCSKWPDCDFLSTPSKATIHTCNWEGDPWAGRSKEKDGDKSAHDTERPISRVERAARMLAAGFGTGSTLNGRTELVAVDGDARGAAVPVAWAGQREESAARSIAGGSRTPAMRRWSRSAAVVALPSFKPDRDAVAALGRVEAVPAALLRVYALEDWQAWPVVEMAAMVVVSGRGAREAVADAMSRILWRVAAVSQDNRAKDLRMRASSYRALTGEAEVVLRRWLDRGATQHLQAVAEIKQEVGLVERVQGARPVVGSGSDPNGMRACRWWDEAEHRRIHGTD